MVLRMQGNAKTGISHLLTEVLFCIGLHTLVRLGEGSLSILKAVDKVYGEAACMQTMYMKRSSMGANAMLRML